MYTHTISTALQNTISSESDVNLIIPKYSTGASPHDLKRGMSAFASAATAAEKGVGFALSVGGATPLPPPTKKRPERTMRGGQARLHASLFDSSSRRAPVSPDSRMSLILVDTLW